MKRSPLPPRKCPIARSGIRCACQNGRISRQKRAGRIKTGRKVVSHVRAPGDSSERVLAGRRKPLRFGGIQQNPEYLEFIRSQVCILLGLRGLARKKLHAHVCNGRVEAAHTGPHGLKQKAADESALPMCAAAHRTGTRSHHSGTRTFWRTWALDRKVLVEYFNGLARKAGIHVGSRPE